jgi:hypothetical protein
VFLKFKKSIAGQEYSCSTMGWEQRGSNQYYSKKEREGSRVKSVYVGRGEIARMISEIQSSSPLLQRLARTIKTPETVKQEKADSALEKVTDLVRLITRHLERTGTSPPVLKAGDRLVQVTGRDSSDSPRTVSLVGNKLLFIYSSKCPACARNFEKWKVIEERAGAGNVIYLSTDTPSEFSKRYLIEHGIVDRAIFLSSEEEKRKLKLTRVPQTIEVVQGEVKAVYVGVLDKPTAIDLAYLNK